MGNIQTTKARVFKEYTPGIFKSSDGWSVIEAEKPEGASFALWIMRDDLGNFVADFPFLSDLRERGFGTFFSYPTRTGRSGDTEHDIKFGPYHFPEGTVVEIRNTAMIRDYKNPDEIPKTTFTVNRVVQNGPRSFVLEMHDKQPDNRGTFANQPYAYNISHIVKILTPGKGKLNIDHSSRIARDDKSRQSYAQKVQEWRAEADLYLTDRGYYRTIRLKRDEIAVYGFNYILYGMLHEIGIGPENEGKWIDEELLGKFIQTANLGRVGLGDGYRGFDIVNIRKLKAWLTKNRHRIFHTIKYTQSKDDRMISEAWGDDFDDKLSPLPDPDRAEEALGEAEPT